MDVRKPAWWRVAAVAVLAVWTVAGCGGGPEPDKPAPAPTASAAVPAPTASPAGTSVAASPAGTSVAGGRKVLVIAEENHEYDRIIGAPDAPYLTGLARTYGTATHLDAGYPTGCPSLAAYLLLTGGTTAGVCDDKSPADHPLAGDNIFHQVTAQGGQWRNYAESAPGGCARHNAGRYLVRHVPATYYLDVRADCGRWAVPMGDPGSGALHDDIVGGTLPAFAFVTPDACDDMHGSDGCSDGLVAAGDRWVKAWLPRLLDGPDYRAGRLVIVITWDEGTAATNHIPTLVIAPSVRHVVVDRPATHCSTLRLTEDLLRVPLLGCAARAPSLTEDLGL